MTYGSGEHWGLSLAVAASTLLLAEVIDVVCGWRKRDGRPRTGCTFREFMDRPLLWTWAYATYWRKHMRFRFWQSIETIRDCLTTDGRAIRRTLARARAKDPGIFAEWNGSNIRVLIDGVDRTLDNIAVADVGRGICVAYCLDDADPTERSGMLRHRVVRGRVEIWDSAEQKMIMNPWP